MRAFTLFVNPVFRYRCALKTAVHDRPVNEDLASDRIGEEVGSSFQSVSIVPSETLILAKFV